MSLDRRLEDLFAADARARRVADVTVRPRSLSRLAFALGATGALVLIAALAYGTGDGLRPAAPPPAIGPLAPTPTMPTSTATACVEKDPVGPAIGGTKAGRFMAIGIERVTVDEDRTEWELRFFIGRGATGQPGAATVPLDAGLEGPDGAVPIVAYAAGPPEGPLTALRGPLRVPPCEAVTLRITTAAIDDGAYTLTLRDVRRPEGDVVTEVVTARLECEPTAGGGRECRNPAGTGSRTLDPVPTSSPTTGGSP